MKARHIVYCVVSLLVCFFFSLVYADTFGTKKKRPKPHEFGTIVLNNFSEKKFIAPVVFKHWIHRSKYTCRLCHVDIGFAMKTGATGITENDNKTVSIAGPAIMGKKLSAQKRNNLMATRKRTVTGAIHLRKRLFLSMIFMHSERAFPRRDLAMKLIGSRRRIRNS